MPGLDTDIYVAIGILSVLSVVGTIGNALVLYVFSQYRQKLTSTIFILTLAGTDFITCCITIPFTIAAEALQLELGYDIVCQVYFFLITTTVPFSAFVMVAIAVDRYLCIVHPFKHLMTIRRAEVIVGCLCIFSVVLGVISATQYIIVEKILYSNATESPLVSTTPFDSNLTALNLTGSFVITTLPNSESSDDRLIIRRVASCEPIITPFFKIYQGIFSSFFGISCIIVMILYALIYRSVLARRRKKFKVVTNTCCGFWTAIPNEPDHTEITTLNNETKVEKETQSDEPNIETKDTEISPSAELHDKAVQKNGSSVITEKDVIIKPGAVSRAKLEKMRIANIKTAFMLSIVTLVFIVAFVPSWLMALQAIDMNFIVFYLYFVYNVANPIIYAFMNESFRNQLKQLVCCGSHGPERGGAHRQSYR
ncbi:hypothetical protein FSP39_011609 [Pinctada imbricata]|uniref:G-protein coupled receptors family 1 profile domain-containing protein n=1 Tax=Pinctada imbricata TaxID=66713 RepID=A0AA88YG44_PINIB|nr:hypothetical protein FSP39_011609 [Pinctada imbricata]